MRIEITETDLWNDGDGWSANGCVVNRYTVDVADGASDLAISRAIKAAAGWSGVGRRDEWAGADCGSWRDGTMGLSAEWRS